MNKTVVVKPATVDAILAALDIPVTSKKDRQKQFQELDNKERARLLPPVMVMREADESAGIPMRFEPGDSQLHWRIVLEEGTTIAGSAEKSILRRAECDPYTGDDWRLLAIEQCLPCGYHRLEIADVVMPLIVVPQRCWVPPQLEHNERMWGLAVQLYLLRSDNNWGVGDFSDLRRLSRTAATWGADLIGLNPLHAMFVDDPNKISPYSPASRLFLNVLNIDVTAIPQYSASPELRALLENPAFGRDLKEAQAASLVDYETILKLKLAALRILFQAFQNSATSDRHGFDTFVRAGSPTLRQFSVFQAIRMAQAASNTSSTDWREWPKEFRNPDSPKVEEFANDHRNEIEFFSWMQWVAETQLAQAATEAKSAGMAVGLYRDLAVGSDAAGFEAWSQPQAVVSRAHAGAPPDILNTAGQDWGLPPFNPLVLRETGYSAFIDLVRANMRHAGALRIDHVVGLQHLYWVPEGFPPSEGAYVRYPFDDLMGILALESHRNQCLVIGEDLGTVPPGFRERAANLGILSSKVLYFEQESSTGDFLAPEYYPPLSLASVGSHDLATLRGWWNSNDIELREIHQLYSDPSEGSGQRGKRAQEKQSLLEALRREGLDPGDGSDLERLSMAVHTFLARSHAGIAMLSMEDLAGVAMQVNLPGSTKQYPNWQRRIPLSLEKLTLDGSVKKLIETISSVRHKEQLL